MKQLLLFISSIILLASCSDKDGSSDSTDSASVINPIDTSIHATSTLTDDVGDPYANSEIINKPGTTTLVTQKTEIYFDSLLQVSTKFILNLEEHITIENYCGITIKNNWAEPVYKIAYKTQNDIVHGYVSQSYIACRVDTLKSNRLVTLTLDYNTSKETFVGKIALFDRGWNIMATTSVELDIPEEDNIPHSYTYYFSFEENNPTGLEGITESFSISTNYDACGYPSYYYQFLWNEKNLIQCPQTFAVSEADLFYQSSALYFPADSLGKKGTVLEVIELEEYGDILKNNTRQIKKDSTVIEYKWNKYSFLSAADTIYKKSKTYSVPAEY